MLYTVISHVLSWLFYCQFFLIAAYLRKSGEVDEWLKLAGMSLEQSNYKQALTCYNQGTNHMRKKKDWDVMMGTLNQKHKVLTKALSFYVIGEFF